MIDLIRELTEKGVKRSFSALGLEFDDLFQAAGNFRQNPYRKHQWVVKENNKFLVINAIPPSELQDHLFWEEWYLQKERGEIHHHVLSLWRPQSFNEVFRAPEFDEIHPEECFGRLWYVIEDPDKRPWLLRR
jgi:hypothetical protein